MSIRVWHAPEPAPATGAATRPGRAPERAPSKAPEPDLLLQGRYIRVHLVTGEVITGTLRRTSTYLLVLESSQGAQVSLYKHGIVYLVEAANGA